MLVPGSVNPLLLTSAAGAAGGGISRSLRFNSADSAYLSRTPASAGNRKTWTWAGWVKRSVLGTRQQLFSAPSNNSYIEWQNDQIGIEEYSGSPVYKVAVSAVQRDPSAWYHFVFAFDTTQATASNRIKIYINGVQQTALSSASYPSQDYQTGINGAVLHKIGAFPGAGDGGNYYYLNGCLADIYFIDGQALDPSSFTETDATTGQLIPKAYTGSYGTNGFRLTFSDNSGTTSTTLGKDSAGSNNWTPNNFSVSSGAGNDSLVDVPTSSGTDSGVGGEVRGNYCTGNPLATVGTQSFANGNLDWTFSDAAYGTISPASGKWYAEATFTSIGGGTGGVGIYQYAVQLAAAYTSNAKKYIDGVESSYGNTFTTNDVIGIAWDADAKQVTFYKNNVSQGAVTYTSSGTLLFVAFRGGTAGNNTCVWNFGQRAFAYTAPSGFKALCTANLPAPLVTKPSTVFDTKLWTGNGSSQTISGLGFSPDLVWAKARSSAYWHNLVDTVRGYNKYLFSNATDAEGTETNRLTSFNSDGFSLGSYGDLNGSGVSVAGWCWDAGSSTVTNTQGSITSSVRANATAGFSIVSYTGTGVTATIGHGLNSAPSLYILKSRSQGSGYNWVVYHTALTATKFLRLNTTDSAITASTVFNDTAPTSSVFSIGNDVAVCGNGQNFIAYCFAPVVGYSAMGSFTASNGAFVYTGFRPRFLLLKCSDTAGRSWVLLDTARGQYNVNDKELYANLADAEYTTSNYDLVSNGFVVRSTSAAYNTGTWIYYAVAESPFQYARAR